MKHSTFGALLLSAALSLCATGASAQGMSTHAGMDHNNMDHGAMMHGHADLPIGVMGAHLMPRGKFMLGYQFRHMGMSGLRMGTDDITPDHAVTTIPNSFAGMPGQPPTLRVVPDEMTMEMHMFGAMYGASDRVTLMAMLPYLEKGMTMITYQGPVGSTVLGRSKQATEGIGDLRLGAVIGLLQEGSTSIDLNMGFSLPTGSITETDQMLTPMGMTQTMRVGYMMQLGSGTVDVLPALTLQSKNGPLSYGAQLRGAIRMGKNDEGYALGDDAALTAWASYRASPWISLSGRIEAETVGRINGQDPLIMGAAPGADPAYNGGDFVTLFAGADVTPQAGALKGHKIGVEFGVPVYQDLNGPMLKRDWSVAVAWRKSF